MEYKNGTPALCWFNYLGLAAANNMDWNAAKGWPIPKSKTKLKKIATMEFDWLDCPDLNQTEDVTHPTIGTEDLSVVSFDASHKPSGTAAADGDSLTTAQALVTNTAGSNSAPPSTSTVIQGSSKLAPIDAEANDLAFMADTVASNAGTADSNAAPPTTNTATQGSSKLAPINVDANDLAFMADTAYPSVESSSDSSSDSSISEDPPEDPSEDFTTRMFYCLAATSAAPPEDMEMELPEEDPDPVTDDANIPDHSTALLSSVGDPQQTLGDGPPTAPPKESTSLGHALAGLGGWV